MIAGMPLQPLSPASPPDPLALLFFENQALTRSDAIALSGRARSTIDPRIDGMLEQGLIIPGVVQSSVRGRRPLSFVLNDDYASFLVVDLESSGIRVAVTDMRGLVHVEKSAHEGMQGEPDAVFDLVSDLVAKLSTECSYEVAGSAVSVAAPLDHDSRRPRRPPANPRWDGYDIPGRMAEILPVPVSVETIGQLRALGEYTRDRAANKEMLYVHASTYVASGAFVNGQLVRGASGEVGHISHVKGDWAENDRCACGNLGCLEAVGSGVSLLRDYGQSRGISSVSQFVDEALAGDTELQGAIREVGRKIGVAASAYVSMMNPRRIVLGGTLARARVELSGGVRQGVHGRAFTLSAEDVEIVISDLGEDAAMVGAATIAVEHFLRGGSPPIVRP